MRQGTSLMMMMLAVIIVAMMIVMIVTPFSISRGKNLRKANGLGDIFHRIG